MVWETIDHTNADSLRTTRNLLQQRETGTGVNAREIVP
jgi:hypothetical protein